MANVQQLGPLDWRIPIVTADGRPTSEFQRRWALQMANNSQIGGITLGAGPPPAIPAPANGAQYADTSTSPYTVYIASGGTWHLAGSPTITGANPTATASDVAVNGSANTFMRSDASPAIQKASASQFGIVKVDGTTITESGGVISATGGGGGGGAAWTVVTSWDQAVDGTVNTVEADLTNYNEVIIEAHGVTLSAGGWRVAQLSTDGGSSWYVSASDYLNFAGTGTTSTDSAIFGHSTSSSSARSCVIHMPTLGAVPTVGRPIFCPLRNAMAFVGSSAKIDRIRLSGYTAAGTPTGANLTGGTVKIIAR